MFCQLDLSFVLCFYFIYTYLGCSLLSFKASNFFYINAECEQNSKGEVAYARDTCKCLLTCIDIIT